MMARRVLGVFGAHGVVPEAWQEQIPAPVLAPVPENSRGEKIRQDLGWAREHLAPWIKRRLTGTSSGDTLQAKYPHYITLGTGQ